MQLANTVLYYKPTCPFCHKVLRFMEGHDISVEMRSVEEGDNRDDLIRIGGKAQVPCLVIDGEPMYESDYIIAYLQGKLSA